MHIVIEINNVSYFVTEKIGIWSKPKRKYILKNINLSLSKKEILGIAGESGSGKTTLAKIIVGIIEPSEGNLTYNFTTNRSRANPVQILFQNNSDLLNPYRVVGEMLDEAIRLNKNKIIPPPSIEVLLSLVGLPVEVITKRCFELSGGERQRVALARLIAIMPQLLILDEPFSAQDNVSKENLINLFSVLREKYGITILCISHDLDSLRNLCEKAIILYKGEIVEQGKIETVLKNPEHPYTKFLIRAEEFNLSYDEIMREIDLL